MRFPSRSMNAMTSRSCGNILFAISDTREKTVRMSSTYAIRCNRAVPRRRVEQYSIVVACQNREMGLLVRDNAREHGAEVPKDVADVRSPRQCGQQILKRVKGLDGRLNTIDSVCHMRPASRDLNDTRVAMPLASGPGEPAVHRHDRGLTGPRAGDPRSHRCSRESSHSAPEVHNR